MKIRLKISIKKKKFHKKKTIFCTLLLSGNNEIKKLNKKFRNKNKPTDVLSFPFYKKQEFKSRINKEREIYIGDIIVNINKINEKKNIKILNQNSINSGYTGWCICLVMIIKKKKDFSSMSKVEKKFLSFLN